MAQKHQNDAEHAPPPGPVPPMPVHLPTSDAEKPHSSPLRDEHEPVDPRLPPEPGNDINP